MYGIALKDKEGNTYKVPYEDLLDNINQYAEAYRIYIYLDCCYSGTVIEAFKKYFKTKKFKKNIYRVKIWFSSAPDKRSFNTEDGSLFN